MAEVTGAKKAASNDGFVLETEYGVTTISNAVVAKIASIATREVEGVRDMGTQFRRLVGKIQPGEAPTQGVNVEVGKKEVAVDLVILVDYGHSIPALAQEIRTNVISRIEEMTGLVVKEVNIEVDDLQIESADEPVEPRVE